MNVTKYSSSELFHLLHWHSVSLHTNFTYLSPLSLVAAISLWYCVFYLPHICWITHHLFFCGWTISFSICCQDSSVLYHVSEMSSFLKLNHIPLYGIYHVLSILSSKNGCLWPSRQYIIIILMNWMYINNFYEYTKRKVFDITEFVQMSVTQDRESRLSL
jgi:hypothetical protein